MLDKGADGLDKGSAAYDGLEEIAMPQSQDSKFEIYDFLRITLAAEHSQLNVRVNLPLIHVLIEKAKGSDIYISTCLEFSQSCEGQTPESATNQLCFIMFEYFFIVLADKSKGQKYLREEIARPCNNHLWDKARKYNLRKYEDELSLIEMSLRNESKSKRFEKLKNKFAISSQSEQNTADNQDITIQHLRDELEKKDKVIKSMQELFEEEKNKILEENKSLRRGGIGHKQTFWTEVDMKVARSAIPIS